MSNRIPIHFDGVCPFHGLPVVQYDECDECLERIARVNEQLPDPFDEVYGG